MPGYQMASLIRHHRIIRTQEKAFTPSQRCDQQLRVDISIDGAGSGNQATRMRETAAVTGWSE